MSRYKVLTKVEMQSRCTIFLEKYVKQVAIEAETMASMVRTQIIPAVLQHQRRLAEAVAATQAADVGCSEQRDVLEGYVEAAGRMHEALSGLEKALHHHAAGDEMDHAKHVRSHVKPAMAKLRDAVDTLETMTSEDLWPLPSYRDLLFIK